MRMISWHVACDRGCIRIQVVTFVSFYFVFTFWFSTFFFQETPSATAEPNADMFSKGKRFASLSVFEEELRKFGQKDHFHVPVYKSGTDARYTHLCCEHYGERRKPTAPRERTAPSMKSGCTFNVRAKVLANDVATGVATVTTDYPVHGPHCLRSADLYNMTEVTARPVSKLAPRVIETLYHMIESGSGTKPIRKFLSKYLPGVVLDSLGVYNICAKVKRSCDANANPNKLPELDVDDQVNTQIDDDDRAAVEAQLRLAVQDAIRTGQWQLHAVLERYKSLDCNFDYRVAKDSEGKPVGVMWMTGHMRGLGQRYGDVLFLDAKHGGSNNLRWPFFGPTIVDSENSPRVIAHCFSSSECGPAINWILEMLKEMVPGLDARLKIVFTDALVQSSDITDVFPNVVHLVCAWHFYTIDVPKALRSNHDYEAMRKLIMDEMVYSTTKTQFEQAWEKFRAQFSQSAIHFLSHWVAIHEQWAGYAKLKLFTLGKEGNTTAEQTNSVFTRMTQNDAFDMVELFEMLLQKDLTDMERRKADVLKGQVRLRTLANEDSVPVRECRSAFSDYATDLFAQELKAADDYTCPMDKRTPDGESDGVVMAVGGSW